MACRYEDKEFKYINTRPNLKHGGEIVLVRGCISSLVKGNLLYIDNIMDKKMCLNIQKYKFLKNGQQKWKFNLHSNLMK